MTSKVISLDAPFVSSNPFDNSLSKLLFSESNTNLKKVLVDATAEFSVSPFFTPFEGITAFVLLISRLDAFFTEKILEIVSILSIDIVPRSRIFSSSSITLPSDVSSNSSGDPLITKSIILSLVASFPSVSSAVALNVICKDAISSLGIPTTIPVFSFIEIPYLVNCVLIAPTLL